jgi:hypothetical protein
LIKRFSLALAAVAALAAVVTPSASARVRYATTVQITSVKKPAGSPMEFRGDVSSSKGKCARNRKVLVFQNVEGPSIRVGSDFADTGGGWFLSVALNPASGDVFYARAPRRQIGDGKTCKAARSSDYTFTF